MARLSPTLDTTKHQREVMEVITKAKESLVDRSIGSKKMFNRPCKTTCFSVEYVGLKLPWT